LLPMGHPTTVLIRCSVDPANFWQTVKKKEILNDMPDANKNPLLYLSPWNKEEEVAGELDMAMDQANQGAQLATDRGDDVIATYVMERARLF